MIVLEKRHLNLLTGRNEVQVTLVAPDGARRERHHAMRVYTGAELVRMSREAGLTVAAAYSGLDGSELTLDSKRFVLLARR